MRFDRRTLFFGLLFAGVAGGFLLLPAVSLVGSLLAPSQPEPATTHVPPLLGEAIWARARKFKGGSLIFAVNTERKAVDAKISRDGEVVKAVSGKFAPCEVKIQKIGKPAR